MKTISIRVPASTANLGPGFDTLGVALKLYNTVAISPSPEFPDDPFIAEILNLFFRTTRKNSRPFHVDIKGQVPRTSGLGSSVTVRLGLLLALNQYYNNPLSNEKALDLAIQLEEHPDNAAAAFYGGFVASTKNKHFHAPISSKLSFVAAIPSFELGTASVRNVLPAKISMQNAVSNIQNTSLVVAAFVSGNYELLKKVDNDCLHEPYRARFIPGFYPAIQAAKKNGALMAYLSGAGPTLMAITLQNAEKIGRAMSRELLKAGNKNTRVKILKADNHGVMV